MFEKKRTMSEELDKYAKEYTAVERQPAPNIPSSIVSLGQVLTIVSTGQAAGAPTVSDIQVR